MGKQIVNWQHALEQKWATLRFGEMKIETNGGQHIFEVQVYLNDLNPMPCGWSFTPTASTAAVRYGRR